MGDISEMMLDGTLCQTCGSYIEEGEAQGFPRDCNDCNPTEHFKKVNPQQEIINAIKNNPSLDTKGLDKLFDKWHKSKKGEKK